MANAEELQGWRKTQGEEEHYITDILQHEIKKEITTMRRANGLMLLLGLPTLRISFRFMEYILLSVQEKDVAGIALAAVLVLFFLSVGITLCAIAFLNIKRKAGKKWMHCAECGQYDVLDVVVKEESATVYSGHCGAVYDLYGEPYEYMAKGKKYLKKVPMHMTMSGRAVLVRISPETKQDMLYEIVLPCYTEEKP